MDLSLASNFPPVSESEWQEAAGVALKGKPLAGLTSKTLDGVDVEPIYPGSADAVRVSRRPRRADELPWDILQRCDVPDIAKANEQALVDLNGGASGLSIVLPGAVTATSFGVPVANTDGFKRLLEGVELDLISVRLDGGIRAREAASHLIDVYRDKNLDLSKCRLTLGLDPVSSFAQTGTIMRRSAIVDLMAQVVSHCRDLGFTGTTFVGDARVYQNAGSSCAQDVGLVAAVLVDNLRSLCQAGIPLNDAVRMMGIVVGVSQDQFATLCKLRALRLVWQRICHALDVEPPEISIETETSWRMMSKQDPYVNMLRTTSAAFAAGIGGADSVTVLPFSFPIGLPDDFARRMACNSQIILQEESGIGRVEDPAAGSGHVEQLTLDLARHGWAFFQKIEVEGGMFAALENGFVHSALSDMANTKRKMVADRRIKLTGVTEFANLNEPEIAVWDIALPDGWSLPQPESGAEAKDGEMVCDRLVPYRQAEDFERLRAAAGRYEQENASPPTCVFLANLGDPAQYTVRATFIRNLLAAGGVATEDSPPLESADQIASAFKASGCPQACICASDAVYAEMAANAAKALKAAGANYVWLAGRPGKIEPQLRAGGVDGFMHDGANILSILQIIHALNGLETTGTTGAANG